MTHAYHPFALRAKTIIGYSENIFFLISKFYIIFATVGSEVFSETNSFLFSQQRRSGELDSPESETDKPANKDIQQILAKIQTAYNEHNSSGKGK